MGKTNNTNKPNQDPPPVENEDLDDDALEGDDSESGVSITLTQAELDRRLARKAHKAVKAHMRKLGLDMDSETASAELQRLRALEANQNTGEETIETLRAENETLQGQVESLTAQLAELNRKAILSQRDSRLLEAAQAATADDPNDVIGWVMRNRPTEYEALVDEDGDIDEEQINALISACMKAKPAWFTSQAAPGSPTVKRGNTSAVKVDEQKRADMETRLKAATGF